MKTWLMAAVLCGVAGLWGFQSALPRCTALTPDTAKAGDVVTAAGEHLDKSAVAEVYLTDGSKDTKVALNGQTATEIKFTVPKIAAGRYHLALLTANRASMIEQPVVLTVE